MPAADVQLTRPTSAAEYEMTLHQQGGATESAVTSQLLMSSAYRGYDQPDSLRTSQSSLQPPHPLDPQATPPMYVGHYSISLFVLVFRCLLN